MEAHAQNVSVLLAQPVGEISVQLTAAIEPSVDLGADAVSGDVHGNSCAAQAAKKRARGLASERIRTDLLRRSRQSALEALLVHTRQPSEHEQILGGQL